MVRAYTCLHHNFSLLPSRHKVVENIAENVNPIKLTFYQRQSDNGKGERLISLVGKAADL